MQTEKGHLQKHRDKKGNEMQHLDRFRRESPGLYWLIIAAVFLVGLWPVGIILIISGSIRDGRYEAETREEQKIESPETLPQGEENIGGRIDAADRTAAAAENPAASAEERAEMPGHMTHRRAAGSGKSKKVMRKSFNRFLIAAGGIFTVIFAISGLNKLFFWLPNDPFLAFRDSYVPFIFTGLSVFAVMAGISRNRRAERYRTYLAILEEREFISLREVADCSPFSMRTVKNDLQDMIDGNFFGADAWIDYSSGCLILTRSGGQAVRKQKEARRTAGISPENPEQKAGGSRTSGTDLNQSDLEILSGIRQIGNTVRNSHIQQQARRIEKITDQILRHETDPGLREKNRKLRSFLEYYLPEALKLLRRYSELEREEIRGENIRTAMQKIEEVMEKVTSAFESQLDDLYQDDMMDIASDIAVMEQMMAKDGLSDDGLKIKYAVSGKNEDRKDQTI